MVLGSLDEQADGRISGATTPLLGQTLENTWMASGLLINKSLKKRKADVLSYLRSRADEALGEITLQVGSSRPKEIAKRINPAMTHELDALTAQVRQCANEEGWGNEVVLPTLLLLAHCTNVVMIDTRNSLRPYEYMDFSRRIGERWEQVCNICFVHPVRLGLGLFTPPLFKHVKQRLQREIRQYIASLPLTPQQRDSLLHYYDQIWSLVDSGSIKLSLDLHFLLDNKRHVVDFKSGFGSNEKGNTNRLLVVGSIYKNIEPEDYTCMIWVRSKEEQTNQYLQILKRSGIWEVSCGEDAYDRIDHLSGFPFKQWVSDFVRWEDDLLPGTYAHLKKQELLEYLQW